MKTDKKMFLEKLKKEYLIGALLVGVALMLLGRGSGDNKADDSGSDVSDISEFEFLNTYEGNDLEYLTYLTEGTTKCLENMEGVGDVKVFITMEPVNKGYTTDEVPIIQGVMVVAEGAENPVVVQDITEACEALFSLSAHKIKVVKMKEET